MVFYQYLRNYLSTDVTFDPSGTSHISPASATIRKKLAHLKKGIQRREALRLERTRLFGMYRTLYLLLGKQFAQQGMLSEARDISLFEENETAHLIQSPENLTRSLIAERKRQGQRWEEEWVPSRVIVPSRPTLRSDSEEKPRLLAGRTLRTGQGAR